MFSVGFVEEFHALFAERAPLYEIALMRTRQALLAVVSDRAANSPADQRRVRVEIGRIKEPNRILVKANNAKYAHLIRNPADIFEHIHDIAGTRVTCNTHEDVRRVEKGLLAASHIHLYSEVSLEKSHEDYLANPKESGYRALHFLLQVEVPAGAGVKIVPCEVQLRTLLQHAWGELTHEDTFKPDVQVPPLVGALSKRLATALAVLDEIAQDLRDELNKIENASPIEVDDSAQNGGESGSRVSTADLEETFTAVFGRVLAIRHDVSGSYVRQIERHGVRDRESLRRLLDDVRTAMRDSFPEYKLIFTDGEILNAALTASLPSKSAADGVRELIEERMDRELQLAALSERFPTGSVQLATVVRVTPRYAIAQLTDGHQAVVSARHLESGTARVDLRDEYAPGQAIVVQIVNMDPGTGRIEAKPASWGRRI